MKNESNKHPIITAMIPIRIGNEKLHKKNIIDIHGRALMSYVIETTIKSNLFDTVVINGDDEIFESITHEWGAKYYSRPKVLSESQVRSDEVVANFFSNYDTDILVLNNKPPIYYQLMILILLYQTLKTMV